MLTQEQIKSNIDSLQKQGASNEVIQSYINSISNKNTTQQPLQQDTPHTGFLKSIVQGIASVPGQFIASATGLSDELEALTTLHKDPTTGKIVYTPSASADKIRKEGVDLGYFGTHKAIGGGYDIFNKDESGKALKSTLGTGIEAATWLIGGPEAKSVATGAKGLGKLALESAKVGVATGAGLGLSDSLKNDEGILDTIINTASNAAIGGAFGAVSAPVIKVIGSGVNNIRSSGAKKGLYNTAEDIIDNTIGRFIKNTTKENANTIPPAEELTQIFKKGTAYYNELYQQFTKDIPQLSKYSDDTKDAVFNEILQKGDKLKTKKYGGEHLLDTESYTKSIKNELTNTANKYLDVVSNDTEKQSTQNIVENFRNKLSDLKAKGLVPDTTDIDNAVNNLTKKYKLIDTKGGYSNLTKKELANLKMNMNLDDILITSSELSSEKRILPQLKESITESLYQKHPELQQLDEVMHKKLLAMEPFIDKSSFKVPKSTMQNAIGTIAGIVAAPQGIATGWLVRNSVNKIAGKFFPGAKMSLSLLEKSQEPINTLVTKLTDSGVSMDTALKFLRESSEAGGLSSFTKNGIPKQSAETLQQLSEEIIKHKQNLIQEGTNEAQNKLQQTKSLIKVLKGLGTDIESIVSELGNAGIVATENDAKTIASMNKNGTKATLPYLEKIQQILR